MDLEKVRLVLQVSKKYFKNKVGGHTPGGPPCFVLHSVTVRIISCPYSEMSASNIKEGV